MTNQYSSARPLRGLHLEPINVLISHESMIPHLEVGFALRCFQRLSRPNIATQRFAWWQSWQTRGSFNPVLSYQGQPPSSINAYNRQRPTCLTHVSTYSYVHWTISSSFDKLRINPCLLNWMDSMQSLRALYISIQIPSVSSSAMRMGIPRNKLS